MGGGKQEHKELLLNGEQPDKRSNCHINKDFIPLKAVYFLYFGSSSFFSPFLSIWYTHIGLTPFQIGILNCLMPLSIIVGSPIFNGLADSFHAHKVTLILCSIAATIARFCLQFPRHMGLLVVVALAGSFLGSPVIPLIDSTTLSLLGEGRSLEYGKQRLWGAIGWGSLAAAAGALMDELGTQSMFYSASIGFFIAILVMLTLKMGDRKRMHGEFWKTLSIILVKLDVWLFLVVALCMGYLAGLITNFLFVYLKEELHASQKIMGLSLTFTCLAEVPFFQISGPIIRKIGHYPVLMIAMAAFSVRLYCYTILEDPWMVLPVELLHGLTYGAGWAACANFAAIVAPKGLQATTQGLLLAVYWGLGQGMGALVGGLAYQRAGPVTTFRWSIVVAGAGFLMCIVAWVRALITKGVGTAASARSQNQQGPGETEKDETTPLALEHNSSVEETLLAVGGSFSEAAESERLV